MKTKTKYSTASSIFVLLFLFILPLSISSQTFDGNIPIPSSDGGGAIIGDILHANNHIFAYSLDKITVYNAASNAFVTDITFPYQIDEHYGKFNPIHFNELYNVPAANMMAYNQNANVLYVVTPELSILTIDVENTTFPILSEYIPPTSDLPDYFKPINGMNIIKFDHIHNRLYWVVTAKDINSTNNCTGQFHSLIRFFGIYKTNANNGTISRYYVEPLVTSVTYEVASIFDIAFNHESDLYYLANMSLLQVYKVTDDGGPDKVEFISDCPIDVGYYGCVLYKFGKLIYINETYPPNNKIHRVIALPYRYLDYPLENADIFILDGDLDTPTQYDWETFPSPSKRILDGIFHTGTQDLILSYSPNPDDILPPPSPGVELTDIATYSYDFNTGTFLYPPARFNTDNSQNYSVTYDKNYSSNLHQVDATNTLVSKKDEIVKLTYSSTYIATPVVSAENNIFAKGVRSTSNKSFIINLTSNGLEVVGSNYNTTSLFNGYAVNHVVSDALSEKFYLFNKLNTYNTGCYVYDLSIPTSPSLVNLNTDDVIGNEISTPIGDCIYNTYLDHFIISENTQFTAHAARIKIFNNDEDNTLFDEVPLEYTDQNNTIYAYYATKMFVAPDEKLYVFANMRYNTNSNPRIFVINANDNESGPAYQILHSFEIDNFPVPGGSYLSTFDFYNGYFCYNHYNQSVYATLSPNEFIYEPYSTVPNSMYEFQYPYSDYTGLLIKIEDDGINTYSMNYPGKIICPDNGNDPANSQYYRKMFIIGRKFYVINTFFDEIIPSNVDNAIFNDIIYSPKHDVLFALRDAEGSCGPHRKIQIFTINVDGSNMSFNQIAEVEGQASCLFNNPYDGKIYFHQKYDEEKLGDVPVKLWHFDYDPTQNPTLDPIDLEITSVYPDANHDGDKHLYLYNITTPAINPYNNTIYIPNGGHSCVSKVSFVPDESLLLNEGTWSWLSFPRLDRDNGNPTVHEVLYGQNGEKIEPAGYRNGSELDNLPIGEVYLHRSIFTNGIWSAQPLLTNVDSRLGYKLYLNYTSPPDQKWLHLSGSLLFPNDGQVDLVENDLENWLGYYLTVTQSPFDAISEDDLEHIYLIKGQYWTCAKFWGDGIPEPYWVCQCSKGKSESLKYGDMAILKTYQEIINFQWQIFGMPPGDITDRAETDNFIFTEQADYTPIFIELDSTENPLEIGAFVEDSCVGATTVFADDSIVLVPAYTEGISGEIYFEEYYGTYKSYQAPIREYYVKNRQTKQKEKRQIHTAEQQDYYLVSFNKREDHQENTSIQTAWISSMPNPIRNAGTIKYYIPDPEYIEISLYDLYGQKQNIIKQGYTDAGTHSFVYKGKDMNGRQLPNGAYILSLKSAEQQAQTKIVIIR